MKPKTVILLGLMLALSASVFELSSFAQAATYAPSSEDYTQELHIDKDGNFKAHQVRVFQIAGTSFYARYYIGLAFLRILIKTGPTTEVRRRFGDQIPLGQIAVGDILNVEGKVENGADSLSIVASKITDFSNQKEIANFQGTITGMGSTTGSFILATKNGALTITTGSTTQIRKGSRIINTNLVRTGDTVSEVVGTYDHSTKTMDANVLVIYINKNIFVERNFEGTLKTITSYDPPVLSFNTEGKDYKVVLSKGATILNKSRQSVSLKRYLEDDTIRIYGAIRQAEEPIIDAEVVRNISLQ